MEQLTTYRANGKTSGLVFLFKYDLNGNFRAFEIVDGVLDDVQMNWLYSGNFPATEQIMINNWCKLQKYTDKFQINKSIPDLSFDALWQFYDYKVGKQEALSAYKKHLAKNQADLIACFVGIAKYKKWLRGKTQNQLNLATIINKRRYEDEYK